MVKNAGILWRAFRERVNVCAVSDKPGDRGLSALLFGLPRIRTVGEFHSGEIWGYGIGAPGPGVPSTFSGAP